MNDEKVQRAKEQKMFLATDNCSSLTWALALRLSSTSLYRDRAWEWAWMAHA